MKKKTIIKIIIISAILVFSGILYFSIYERRQYNKLVVAIQNGNTNEAEDLLVFPF